MLNNLNKKEIIREKSNQLSEFQKGVRKKKFFIYNIFMTSLILINISVGLGLYVYKQKNIECLISYANGDIEPCNLTQQEINNINNVLNNSGI
jgi:hypothetical protein